MQNTYPYHPPLSQGLPGVSYDSSSVSSVTSPQPPAHTTSAALHSTPPSRPGTGFKMSHLLHPPSVLGQSPSMAAQRPHSYDSASGSPGEPPYMLAEAHQANGMIPENSGQAQVHMPSASQQHQKRAYRQRRKDPSCDACRERKVKCDASESSSCTECSNRNVRCQFTKETNRRMSSIKQVQDLERQLANAKQQLSQFRSSTSKGDGPVDLDVDSSGQSPIRLPDVGYHPPRRNRPAARQCLSAVRSNVRNYGKGIMKMPPPYRQIRTQAVMTENLPVLPPRNVANHLLGQYFSHIHSVLPILHWPTFLADYDKVYQKGSLHGAPREWAAVLFSVFACGAQHTLDSDKFTDGKDYVKTSMMIIDVWQDEFSMDQARAALLLSIFLFEMNLKSASWVWLGSAVRTSQDIGLHIESGPWSAVDGEMRKRVWWGIYAWDRLIALELGKPILIDDRDCDVDLPCPVDDQYISDSGQLPEGQVTTPLLATIHVVRSISQLTRTLRSTIITAGTLETFEHHFNACLATFPPQYHANSNQYLDPRSLAPIVYLQNARLVLHRHNFSPVCPEDVRYNAVNYCIAVAQGTTRLLSRCMLTPSSPTNASHDSATGDWHSLMPEAATTMLCTHIWRCILLLLFRQEYSSALICIQMSSAIGDARVVNASCGRYIAFFLKCLLERYHSGNVTGLEQDEEMMAYVSGDLQNSTDGSWIWHGSETGMQLNAVSPPGPANPAVPTAARHDAIDVANTQPNPDAGAQTWEGWAWVEQTVKSLLNDQQHQHQRHEGYSPNDTRAPAGSGYQTNNNGNLLRPPPVAETSSAPRPSPSASSRMTIASII